MNHILALTQQVRQAEGEAARVAEELKELRGYLQSSKFNCGSELDGYVSIQDVLSRLPRV